MASHPKTAARKSYEKHREAMRQSSLVRLQARAGGAPLTVSLRAQYAERNENTVFIVTGPGVAPLSGQYRQIANFIDGFVKGWTERHEADIAAGAFEKYALAFASENPKLYEVARDACHERGIPWTDPRNGITYDPPDPNAAAFASLKAMRGAADLVFEVHDGLPPLCAACGQRHVAPACPDPLDSPEGAQFAEDHLGVRSDDELLDAHDLREEPKKRH